MKIYASSSFGTDPKIGGQSPIYGLNGLIIGYKDNTTGKTVTGTNAPSTTTAKNKPQQNSEGIWTDTTTGQPYHGAFSDATGTSYYSNGKQVSNPADVGAQTPVFDVTRTVKNPAITGAIDTTVASQPINQAALSKTFADYLAEAKAAGTASKTQLATDINAINPQPTIDRANTNTASTAAALTKANDTYTTGQQKVLGDVANANAAYQKNLGTSLDTVNNTSALTADELRRNNENYAANVRGIQSNVAATNQGYSTTVADRLANLKSTLDAQNAQYEQASQAVAGQAWDKARQQLALYQLGSGTPTSGSGNLSNRAIRAYSAINIPLQQELAARRYAQTGALDTQQSAASRELYGNTMGQLAGASALESDLNNRGNSLDQYLQANADRRFQLENTTSGQVNQSQLGTAQAASGVNADVANRASDIARYIGSNDTQTAQYIQSLLTQTAGMSRSMTAQYLQQLAVPIQIAQQIMAGNLSNLGQLSSLDQNANFYTVSQPYDTSRLPAVNSYSPVAPSRGYTPASLGGGGNNSSPTLSDTLASAGVTTGNGSNWVQGSDGNYYVPDSSQPTGYRMVYKTNQLKTPAGGAYKTTQNYGVAA